MRIHVLILVSSITAGASVAELDLASTNVNRIIQRQDIQDSESKTNTASDTIIIADFCDFGYEFSGLAVVVPDNIIVDKDGYNLPIKVINFSDQDLFISPEEMIEWLWAYVYVEGLHHLIKPGSPLLPGPEYRYNYRLLKYTEYDRMYLDHELPPYCSFQHDIMVSTNTSPEWCGEDCLEISMTFYVIGRADGIIRSGEYEKTIRRIKDSSIRTNIIDKVEGASPSIQQ